MKPESNFRKWLIAVVVVGFTTGLTMAVVGVKVPAAVLTVCVALPIVGLAMRRSLWKAAKQR